MSYYRTCPHCGAHLDSGERCDCRDEKTAADAANIDDGAKVERDLTAPDSASMIPSYEQKIKEES